MPTDEDDVLLAVLDLCGAAMCARLGDSAWNRARSNQGPPTVDPRTDVPMTIDMTIVLARFEEDARHPDDHTHAPFRVEYDFDLLGFLMFRLVSIAVSRRMIGRIC